MRTQKFSRSGSRTLIFTRCNWCDRMLWSYAFGDGWYACRDCETGYMGESNQMADTWTWSCGDCGARKDGVPFRGLDAVNEAHECPNKVGLTEHANRLAQQAHPVEIISQDEALAISERLRVKWRGVLDRLGRH